MTGMGRLRKLAFANRSKGHVNRIASLLREDNEPGFVRARQRWAAWTPAAFTFDSQGLSDIHPPPDGAEGAAAGGPRRVAGLMNERGNL